MADLGNILVQAYRDGYDAAQVDYATGSVTTSEGILDNYPEAGDLVLYLIEKFETQAAAEIETLSEEIVKSWEGGYASFDVLDWLDHLSDDDDLD